VLLVKDQIIRKGHLEQLCPGLGVEQMFSGDIRSSAEIGPNAQCSHKVPELKSCVSLFFFNQ
jgi:hypothetical protein